MPRPGLCPDSLSILGHRRSVDDGSRSLISLMRIITQTVAVLRYSSASAITAERSTTTAHSDASWQHCSQTSGACLATMAPSLPGGHRRTASSAAVRRLWQQRCLHRTAARPLALPSRQRCVNCCATRSAGAALALHQGSARASGASGQRQRPRGAARGHTHSKIERESGHKRGHLPLTVIQPCMGRKRVCAVELAAAPRACRRAYQDSGRPR